MIRKAKKNLLAFLYPFLCERTLFYALLPYVKTFRANLVNQHTEICIEAFPRSGNNYFCSVFRRRNPQVQTANHAHLARQLKMAAKRNLPAVVLIRKPQEAITSLLVMDDSLLLDVAIWRYLRFYRALRPFRDQLLVAKFEDVIQRPHQIINQINLKWQTAFHAREVTPEEAILIREGYVRYGQQQNLPETWLPLPTPMKDRKKQAWQRQVQQHPKFQQAVALYEFFTSDDGLDVNVRE